MLVLHADVLCQFGEHAHVRVPLQASEGVRDIMHRMLTPDPKQRITVAQIMAHPWFCTDLPAGVTELNETLLATAAAAEVDDYDASCSLIPGVSGGRSPPGSLPA